MADVEPSSEETTKSMYNLSVIIRFVNNQGQNCQKCQGMREQNVTANFQLATWEKKIAKYYVVSHERFDRGLLKVQLLPDWHLPWHEETMSITDQDLPLYGMLVPQSLPVYSRWL